MKIVINNKVQKELKYFPKHDSEKILDKIFLLGGNALGLDIKKIQPHHLETYRLRVGNYRIIFKHSADTIYIIKIDTRESIYDSL